MDGLLHLLKAPSKKAVDDVFAFIFKNRFGTITEEQQTQVAQGFGISNDEASELISSARLLIQNALYEYQPPTLPKFATLFPSGFHPNLLQLLSQLLTARLPTWRDASISSISSLPRMTKMDWRIDVKSASDSVYRMSVPTVLVGIQVQGSVHSKVGEEPPVKNVVFELNKETIATMIDGLKFVQGQLNSIK
eukprot:TRINITY_DN3076_c0_g1_i1.p1 TRINITY_DN3076_c0_g1~~TRINITY_DN3076_c0_g1_i1.p1  ORF type:complete len:192 (-),score=41.27 TRINITY_DN3076_c0_g1_i1:89-664(-)